MKKLNFVALTTVSIGILFSCQKKIVCIKSEVTDPTVLVSKSGISYAESIANWSELKRSNGNSYTYKTAFTSWIGESSITEVKVEDGSVISRTYEHFKTNEPNGQKETIDSYSETIENLGVHENGARPVTIDELYSTCSSEYLTADVTDNTIHFETELNGLMTLCGFVPKGCADDCFTGVSINYFEWTN